jgi:hypothetical protein
VTKSGKLLKIAGWEKVITTAFDMSFEVTPGQFLDITVTGNPRVLVICGARMGIIFFCYTSSDFTLNSWVEG